ASGGSTTDAGAVNQLADIKTVTDSNARSAVFGGQSEAMGLREKAGATLLEGRARAIKSSASWLSNKDIKDKKGKTDKKNKVSSVLADAWDKRYGSNTFRNSNSPFSKYIFRSVNR
ncbi:MAG: hypothetical protein AB2796_07025, partial [Candidatus Thiodiazotropha sp.]